jgi:hypothetical protein
MRKDYIKSDGCKKDPVNPKHHQHNQIRTLPLSKTHPILAILQGGRPKQITR